MKRLIAIMCIGILGSILPAQKNTEKNIGTVSAKEAMEPTLVTIHAEDAFLPSILAILASESGYNIVTDPNVNRQDKIQFILMLSLLNRQ